MQQAGVQQVHHGPDSAPPTTALPCSNWAALQVAERAAEEKKREQAGLQKERLLLEKKAKKKQADADKRVGAGERHALGRTDSRHALGRTTADA